MCDHRVTRCYTQCRYTAQAHSIIIISLRHWDNIQLTRLCITRSIYSVRGTVLSILVNRTENHLVFKIQENKPPALSPHQFIQAVACPCYILLAFFAIHFFLCYTNTVACFLVNLLADLSLLLSLIFFAILRTRNKSYYMYRATFLFIYIHICHFTNVKQVIFTPYILYSIAIVLCVIN